MIQPFRQILTDIQNSITANNAFIYNTNTQLNVISAQCMAASGFCQGHMQLVTETCLRVDDTCLCVAFAKTFPCCL